MRMLALDLADLEHELYQLMRLHREMRSWRWRPYPKTIDPLPLLHSYARPPIGGTIPAPVGAAVLGTCSAIPG
jgi:hypothetical protein